MLIKYSYLTGFLKDDWIFTVSLFLFIGPANGYTCTLHIHNAISGLGWLVCFSRASSAGPVNWRLRQWDPWRALHGTHGCKIHPRGRETSINAIQACLGQWLALLGPIASPNGPNGGFSLSPASHLPPPPARPPSHPPTTYIVPSVILQWFWEKLLKIQQCKLASRNSYKTLAKRLFQLHSISGMATI